VEGVLEEMVLVEEYYNHLHHQILEYQRLDERHSDMYMLVLGSYNA
jgi:hypothetical protein